MQLIDSGKLIEYCNNQKVKTIDANDIARFPTVDAAPVKHGRWELVDEAEPQRYGCSKCSCLSWYGTYRYCPNCGAKMDLDG